jgi:hypothetical protein
MPQALVERLVWQGEIHVATGVRHVELLVLDHGLPLPELEELRAAIGTVLPFFLAWWAETRRC